MNFKLREPKAKRGFASEVKALREELRSLESDLGHYIIAQASANCGLKSNGLPEEGPKPERLATEARIKEVLIRLQEITKT